MNWLQYWILCKDCVLFENIDNVLNYDMKKKMWWKVLKYHQVSIFVGPNSLTKDVKCLLVEWLFCLLDVDTFGWARKNGDR